MPNYTTEERILLDYTARLKSAVTALEHGVRAKDADLTGAAHLACGRARERLGPAVARYTQRNGSTP